MEVGEAKRVSCFGERLSHAGRYAAMADDAKLE